MASGQKAGSGIDLEKELGCSICTDILYQPLTILDCLHTFCGSCLKEWFQWQATSATHSSRAASPYTCPSCRATVRAARPNANVTTLLEMFLQANPGKGKTEEEKAEMRSHYKPGDDVLPPVEVHPESETDSEDERLLDEVRQISVADLNPAVEANRRADRVARRRQEQESLRPSNRRDAAADARRRQEAVERNVAHQPSLRSLLSASGENTAEVQQEILNSIMSSGVLDGVDIDNLTAEQEEELAERITEAYHRRHAARARDNRAESEPPRTTSGGTHTTSTHSTPPRSRPPVSRPHLIEQWTQDSAASSRRTTPAERRRESSTSRTAPSAAPPPTARSVTDPSSRGTERNDAARETARRTRPESRSNTIPAPSLPYPTNAEGTAEGLPLSTSQPRTPPNTSRTDIRRVTPPYPADTPSAAVGQANQTTPGTHTPSLLIPEVSCNRCGRENIQHDLHYHCGKCSDRDFDLCLRCYRAGQGCNHWFGFGYMAMTRWQRNAPPSGWPPGYELPHVLSPRRYLKQSTEHSVRENALQEGAFCERCFQYADESYWHCSTCFEGAFGFCNTCVQQDKHCTHPLTPVARIRTEAQARSVASGVSRPMPLPHLPPNSYFFQLPRSDCAVCHHRIPAKDTRFHCAHCSGGNYDICNDSYQSLVAMGKISTADGPSGQRRCLQGHPLMVVKFIDLAEDIQQRVIVAGNVGGWEAMHGRSRMPVQSSGSGVTSGLRALALWSWWPSEGIEDELAFPKLAELREVKEINADYHVGVYAGARGLYPANHVKLI